MKKGYEMDGWKLKEARIDAWMLMRDGEGGKGRWAKDVYLCR